MWLDVMESAPVAATRMSRAARAFTLPIVRFSPTGTPVATSGHRTPGGPATANRSPWKHSADAAMRGPLRGVRNIPARTSDVWRMEAT